MPDNQPLQLNDIVNLAPESITAEQREFLSSKTDELDDETVNKFGLERKLDVPEPIKAELVPGESPGATDELLGKYDDEEKKVIEAIADQKMRAFGVDKVSALERVVEITDFISERPQFKPFRKKMLEFIKASPDIYGKLPVEQLAHVVAGRELAKIGARKEREVQKKVGRTRNEGEPARSSVSDGRSKVDWDKMDDSTYFKERQKMLTPLTGE